MDKTLLLWEELQPLLSLIIAFELFLTCLMCSNIYGYFFSFLGNVTKQIVADGQCSMLMEMVLILILIDRKNRTGHIAIATFNMHIALFLNFVQT